MRNEAPFILEWVAYHQSIGFEKIIVFSNDCTDGTEKILEVLDAAGEIVHVPHDPSGHQKVSEQVSQIALERGLVANGDWAIWLDADEFLNIHVEKGTVADLIPTIGAYRGMCISWRIFGDANQQTFPGEFLSETFTSCAAPGQAWQTVKTFFQMGPEVTEFFQHKPMLSRSFWDGGGAFMSSNGKPLDPTSEYSKLWKANEKRGKVSSNEAGWSLAQINHYAVRTPGLFAHKKLRGRIGAKNAGGKQRYTARYYQNHNLNSDSDSTILRWSRETRLRAWKLAERIRLDIDLPTLIGETYGDEVTFSNEEKVEKSADTKRYQDMHQNHYSEMAKRDYSNSKLAKALIDTVQPETVIDVGCGIGVLNSHLEKNGAHVLGLEADWLHDDVKVLPTDRYRHVDLEKPFSLNERFDLCCCIEVAEHLEKSRADGFISDLCRLSDVIAFSAAIPGQGGKGHKNEQWQEYWCQKFVAQGYKTFDPYRDVFRRDPGVMPWIQQNLLLFIKDRHSLVQELEHHIISPEQSNMILPNYHLKVLRRTRRRLRKRLPA